MKNASLLFFTLFATFSLFGQNRNGISYQALIASPVNENGISISLPGKDQQLISYRNREVCLRFSFLDSSGNIEYIETCLLYTSPSPRDRQKSRMPSSA